MQEDEQKSRLLEESISRCAGSWGEGLAPGSEVAGAGGPPCTGRGVTLLRVVVAGAGRPPCCAGSCHASVGRGWLREARQAAPCDPFLLTPGRTGARGTRDSVKAAGAGGWALPAAASPEAFWRWPSWRVLPAALLGLMQASGRRGRGLGKVTVPHRQARTKGRFPGRLEAQARLQGSRSGRKEVTSRFQVWLGQGKGRQAPGHAAAALPWWTPKPALPGRPGVLS